MTTNSITIGWIEKTLKDVAIWGSGGTPKSTIDEYYGGNIPWLIIADLNDGYINFSKRKITELGLKNSSAKIIPPGNVLVAMYGSIGKLGINLIPLATNQAIAFTKKLKEVSNKFLFYYLLSIRSKLFTLGKGGTQRNISQTVLKKVPINLPPLPEQRKIVEIIEELFSELDKGVESLKKAREQLKTYRQAVLKAAFEGKFTYDKDSKTSPDLANGIRKNNKENHIDPKFSLPQIPANWIWTRNETLLKYVTSGSRDWKKYYSDKGALFIRTQNINTNKLTKENVAFVELPEKVEGKRSLIEKHDILITITGANVGKVALIDFDIEEAYVSQSVALLKYLDSRITKFLYYYFQAPNFGKTFIDKMVYGMGRPVLSLPNMKNVPIALPPIAQQELIIQEIESHFSICDHIEKTIDESLSQAEALRQSILKQAFEGKLTVKWREENKELLKSEVNN